MMRFFKSAALVVALFLFFGLAACSAAGDDGPLRILLNTATDPVTVDVLGLSPAQLTALAIERPHDEWTRILRVATGADLAPMVGDYTVVDQRLRFTPMFPLDPGRAYSTTRAWK